MSEANAVKPGRQALRYLAREISSKNAGNYFLTFDIVFDDTQTYERVRQSGLIAPQTIAALYGLEEGHVVNCIYFDPANAIKITLRRPRVSGDIGESDVFGAQQYAPLLDLEIPLA